MRRAAGWLVISVLAAWAAALWAQQSTSESIAGEIVKRLTDRELTAFAAPVPDDPSRFVAALHIPGTQLLVITARYPAPALLSEVIAQGEYRRAYTDLNAAGERTERLFVEDLGADGLQAARQAGEPFDITWRDGTVKTQYDGKWKEQKLSEQEYRARYRKDETEYHRALQALLSALREGAGAATGRE